MESRLSSEKCQKIHHLKFILLTFCIIYNKFAHIKKGILLQDYIKSGFIKKGNQILT